MRIGFDARILANKRSGISQYLFNLAKQCLVLDNDIEIILFSNAEVLDEYKELLKSNRVKVLVFGQEKKQKKRWAQVLLPKVLKEQKIDVYHAVWNNAVPLRRPCPCVLTLHDLAPWILSGHFRNRYKEFKYKLQHFICAHSADAILTVSYASKRDISRLCMIPDKKIVVTYLGVNEDFIKINVDNSTVNQILIPYGLNGKQYIIDHAGIEHLRRNPELLIRAFADFVKKQKDFFLVLTGAYLPNSKQHSMLLSAIKELGIKDKVIITGWLEDKILHTLISQAKISVIPSLYEGFCLPLIEAFACGTPVITTACGSLAEIASDAAMVLADPYNYEVLSQNIQRLVGDEDYRKNLIRKGLERLQSFSWNTTAEKTLNTYRNVYGSNKS